MSLFAVTNRREASTSENAAAAQPESIARRTRRALIYAGWLALILGQALGMLVANPALLTDHLPFTLDTVAISLIGFALAGLLTGAISGLALRGASFGLRLAVALFGVLIALIAFDVSLGFLRGLTLAEALVDAQDGVKLGMLALGMLGAGVGALAGRPARPRVVTTGAAAQPAAPRASRRASAAQPAARSNSRSGSRQSSQARGQGRSQSRGARGGQTARSARQTTGHGRRRASPARASASSAPASSNSISVSPIRTGVSQPEAKPAKRKKSLFGRRKSVHLGKEQSAVCPFCLEEVRSNDPRGKVVCRICGAAHHADCWAITGKCEVPHLQT